MKKNENAFSLIEVMLTVAVVSICLLPIIKLVNVSRISLTQSTVQLAAQTSADELLQQIRLMKWDDKSVPGKIANISKVKKLPSQPASSPRTAIEDWHLYADVDSSRAPYGPFTRKVTVAFVELSSQNKIVASTHASDYKQVTVTAWGPPGSKSTGTVSAIFYNRP